MAQADAACNVWRYDVALKFTAIANSADRELQLLCFFGRDVEEGATFAAQAKASQSQ